mmetsp:Transcript_8366/g.12721  ORF Transcript_8366/g.12721 Transcript_8366/m.12721 type:complete len:542 (-) Transcript_8366:62-1687(-)
MHENFYTPLRKIDAKRAPQPQRVHIPSALDENESPQEIVARYQASLDKARAARPHNQFDLVLLGVGGAYPVLDAHGKTKLHGGHIGFNEPQTPISEKTQLVTLTEKTRKDTTFRFSSLKSLLDAGEFPNKQFSTDVPKLAVTMGPADIMRGRRVLVLATGENKAPVMKSVFDSPVTSDFPATYLKQHPNTKWLLDESAAFQLKHRPWDTLCANTTDMRSQEWFWQAIYDFVSVNQTLPTTIDQLPSAVRPKSEQVLSTLVKQFQQHLLNSSQSEEKLPRDKTVLIVSPHPDDDVICMGATIPLLLKRNNDVHVVYAVTGSNSVRTSEPLFKQLAQNTPNATNEVIKAQVREHEATQAVKVLGLSESHLHFFRADYYMRRGIPGVAPFSENDKERMRALINQLSPHTIFFAAENDPHGAHGLATQLIAKTYQENDKLVQPDFYGYRGAYAEWPIFRPDELIIVRYGEDALQTKISSIKEHKSQLDPLFPSFDPRTFWQRAKERNQHTGAMIKTICQQQNDTKNNYAEVYKYFKQQQFIERYG